MLTPTTTMSTTTAVPILPAIADRWSPRSYAATPVSDEDLTGLLEAARWAPSCFGAEPWRFVIGVAGRGEGHAAIASTLMDANRAWAAKAPILMVALAREAFEFNDQPNAWAAHDVGLAMGQLGVEATARGLVVHQMGGFDAEQAKELLGVPDGYRAISAIAVGHPGPPENLPGGPDGELAERERAPRSRKPLSEVAFEGTFGASYAG